jgi:hypothetical protein
MQYATEHHFISFGNAAIAYLCAVTSVSFSFTLLIEGAAFIHNGGFETATTYSFPMRAFHLLVVTLLMFVIGWLFSFITAFVPFVIGMAAARWLKIKHWLYFVVGGAVTAIAISPLWISLQNLGINVQEPEPPFLEKFWSSLPLFLASGLIAGVVCWRYLHRNSSSNAAG